jgi:hypothetical protein
MIHVEERVYFRKIRVHETRFMFPLADRLDSEPMTFFNGYSNRSAFSFASFVILAPTAASSSERTSRLWGEANGPSL